MKALDAADAAEPDGAALSQSELAAKIAALQEKQDWHKELLAQLQDGEDKQVSVTDPDTRKMPTAHGTMVGYNAQMAVDARHKLIAADEVTNEVTGIHRHLRVVTHHRPVRRGHLARVRIGHRHLLVFTVLQLRQQFLVPVLLFLQRRDLGRQFALAQRRAVRFRRVRRVQRFQILRQAGIGPVNIAFNNNIGMLCRQKGLGWRRWAGLGGVGF